MITSPDGFSLAPTQTGHLICRHYIRFDTAKKFSELTQTATCSEIIETLSYAAEFETMTVKHNEKRQLKDLNAKILFKRPARAGAFRNQLCCHCQ
jgi:replicative superfamily II helicase